MNERPSILFHFAARSDWADAQATEELADLKRLKRENAELRRANDILKAAATFFGAELDRQSKR